jgi:hypothetical protein
MLCNHLCSYLKGCLCIKGTLAWDLVWLPVNPRPWTTDSHTKAIYNNFSIHFKNITDITEFLNSFSLWIRGLGRIVGWKNRDSKISRHCPFILQNITILLFSYWRWLTQTHEHKSKETRLKVQQLPKIVFVTLFITKFFLVWWVSNIFFSIRIRENFLKIEILLQKQDCLCIFSGKFKMRGTWKSAKLLTSQPTGLMFIYSIQYRTFYS